jgi:hypothetical protein
MVYNVFYSHYIYDLYYYILHSHPEMQTYSISLLYLKDKPHIVVLASQTNTKGKYTSFTLKWKLQTAMKQFHYPPKILLVVYN